MFAGCHGVTAAAGSPCLNRLSDGQSDSAYPRDKPIELANIAVAGCDGVTAPKVSLRGVANIATCSATLAS